MAAAEDEAQAILWKEALDQPGNNSGVTQRNGKMTRVNNTAVRKLTWIPIKALSFRCKLFFLLFLFVLRLIEHQKCPHYKWSILQLIRLCKMQHAETAELTFRTFFIYGHRSLLYLDFWMPNACSMTTRASCWSASVLQSGHYLCKAS